nr:Chain A, De novo mini protein EEH_04 [synthetic construct]
QCYTFRSECTNKEFTVCRPNPEEVEKEARRTKEEECRK